MNPPNIYVPRRQIVHPYDRRDFVRWLGLGAIAAALPNLCFGSRSNSGSTSNYLNNASALAGPQNWSAMGWMYLNTIIGNQTILCMNSATDRQNQGQTVAAAFWASSYDGTTSNAAINATVLTTGVWYHWGLIFASTTSRSAFIDGSVATNTTSINPTGMDRTSMASYNGSVAANPLNGLLAHTALWSTTLTAAEMASGAKGISPQKIRMAALVDYWPLVGAQTNAIGVKGVVLTQTGTVANSTNNPRIYR